MLPIGASPAQLYLVIKVLGAIIASIGPMPDTPEAFDYCRERAQFINGQTPLILDEFSAAAGKTVAKEDVSAVCLPFDHPPEISDPK